MTNINIKPLGDKIIVKRVDERTTEGGIVIPETSGDKSQRGLVVAAGPGKKFDGKLDAMFIKCGDYIVFGKYSGTEITLKGIEYLIMREDDVIGIID